MVALAPAVFGFDREGARASYQRARELEAELRARPPAERSEDQYQAAVNHYGRVPRLDPAFEGCDNSLYNEALLCREAFRAFQQAKWLNRALRSADWLLNEYPHSPLRDEALLLRGDIQAEDLRDAAAARNTYEVFLRRFARSRLAPEARRKLAALDSPAGQAAPAPQAETAKSPGKPSAPAAPAGGQKPASTLPAASPRAAEGNAPRTVSKPGPAGGVGGQLLEIRYWSTADYTRIVMELDRAVEIQHNEVENPYRIYIDFQQTVLSPAVKGKNYAVGDLFLDRIRAGQYQEGVARVVLDFKQKGSFTIFTLNDPYRVVIDIRDASKSVSMEERKKKLAKLFQDIQKKTPTAKAEETELPDKKAGVAGKPPESAPKKAEAAPKKTETAEKKAEPVGKKPAVAPVAPPAAKPAAPPPGKKAEAPPAAPDKKAETVPPAAPETAPVPSQPTSEGKRTLARILGMKVAKIVIDPGHGGKDCGSIGWNGIMEKDVTLAIAKRLKVDIEQRLATEVILTRDRDVFVPLEQRTAIANVEQADLFISLHSNSSKNDRIAGIESFYLGLTREPRAQMLAALENASAQQNLNELEDVIKKITMYEKMNESKEFALKVHRKLFSTLKKLEPNIRDRGVKKAPFVVLIGADVPSILLEIGFISNKKEAEIISSAATQEKVASGISKGIEDYLAGLGTLARNPVPSDGQPANGKAQ
jgi:N-acetylmuramoyl-L-alanine amidase